mmetsp:Transcript_4481/g.10325  ORF Transcript_4481/g.10325 Transcript_4481/m.10325 type:complete len:217 (+) Transcript_4481:413-1063(+)
MPAALAPERSPPVPCALGWSGWRAREASYAPAAFACRARAEHGRACVAVPQARWARPARRGRAKSDATRTRARIVWRVHVCAERAERVWWRNRCAHLSPRGWSDKRRSSRRPRRCGAARATAPGRAVRRGDAGWRRTTFACSCPSGRGAPQAAAPPPRTRRAAAPSPPPPCRGSRPLRWCRARRRRAARTWTATRAPSPSTTASPRAHHTRSPTRC